jgi:hypothetical protein
MAKILTVASWGPLEYSGTDVQRNYFRIPFGGAPTVLATSYLAEVSTGGANGQAGVAVAAFKRFEFVDDNGLVQETEITSVASWLLVARCVSITIALDLQDATGLGGWTFYDFP